MNTAKRLRRRQFYRQIFPAGKGDRRLSISAASSGREVFDLLPAVRRVLTFQVDLDVDG